MNRNWPRIALCASCLVLSSCDIQSGSDAGSAVEELDATPGCELLQGAYTFEYRRRSGDCDDFDPSLGAIDEQLHVFPETVRFVDGKYVSDDRCLRDRIQTVASCDIEVARTCALRTPSSGNYTVAGTLSRLDDGTLEGMLRLTIMNLGISCSDVYTAVAEPVD